MRIVCNIHEKANLGMWKSMSDMTVGGRGYLCLKWFNINLSWFFKAQLTSWAAKNRLVRDYFEHDGGTKHGFVHLISMILGRIGFGWFQTWAVSYSFIYSFYIFRNMFFGAWDSRFRVTMLVDSPVDATTFLSVFHSKPYSPCYFHWIRRSDGSRTEGWDRGEFFPVVVKLCNLFSHICEQDEHLFKRKHMICQFAKKKITWASAQTPSDPRRMWGAGREDWWQGSGAICPGIFGQDCWGEGPPGRAFPGLGFPQDFGGQGTMEMVQSPWNSVTNEPHSSFWRQIEKSEIWRPAG